MHDLLAGVGDLGRGFRFWVTSPRLMLLGAVPALIVGAVWTTGLVLLVVELGPIAAWATPSADGWAEPWRGLLRLAVGAVVLIAALLVAGLTFTAVTLTVGDPFYERISRAVEERLGDPPAERDEPWLRGVARAAGDGILLLLASLVVGAVAFLLGLVPFVGAVLAAVFGATVGGWFLVVELTGTPFDARGYTLGERRRLLRRHRGRAVGFGAATWALFLVPLGAVFVMPAAVGGATVLTRTVLATTPTSDVRRPADPVDADPS